MRTYARVPSAATALLLAAFAFLVSGCSFRSTGMSKPCLRDPITVYAIVEWNGKTATMRSSQEFADKKLIRLSKKLGDTVQWLSPDGLVFVDKWTPEMPFEGPPKHEKKILKSGLPKKTGAFGYEARLVLFSDGTEHPIDPIIEIMD